MGEVQAIDDYDIVTFRLLDGGIVKVPITDLIVEENAKEPHMEDRVVHILGTEYKILFRDKEQDPKLNTCDGYADFTVKEIVVAKTEYCENSVRDLEAYSRKIMRHEIAHAFLYESGLWNNSHSSKSWAMEEELTDWIAIQAPKMFKAFKEAGCEE